MTAAPFDVPFSMSGVPSEVLSAVPLRPSIPNAPPPELSALGFIVGWTQAGRRACSSAHACDLRAL